MQILINICLAIMIWLVYQKADRMEKYIYSWTDFWEDVLHKFECFVIGGDTDALKDIKSKGKKK